MDGVQTLKSKKLVLENRMHEKNKVCPDADRPQECVGGFRISLTLTDQRNWMSEFGMKHESFIILDVDGSPPERSLLSVYFDSEA